MNSRMASLSRYPLMLTALMALAACNKTETPAAADPAAAPAPAAEAAPAAPAEGATPAPAPATPDPEIQPAATATPPSGPAPVAGTDFTEIAGGQPFEPVAGKIEVAEIFSYTCPHCAQFEPLLVDWRKKQTADVKFTPVAGPFGANPIPFEKAFYTAQALGVVGKSHEAMFRAVHIDRTINFQSVTDEQLGKFYAQYGVSAQDFVGTMNSFAINAKAKQAEQFMQRSGVNASPSLVIAGKYLVTTEKGFEDMLRVADHLIARERAAMPAAAAAPAADAAPAAKN